MKNIQEIQPWLANFISDSPTNFKVLRSINTWITPCKVTWEELSKQVNYPVNLLKEMNKYLSRFSYLREGTNIIHPGAALAVSYTEEGLKWAVDNKCNSLYFSNVKLSNGKFNGDLEKNKYTFVEDFKPHNHYFSRGKNGENSYINKRSQIAEFAVCDKAFRMLYVPSYVRHESPKKVLVYSTENKD